MCNLSQGVLERGIERGMAQGMAQGVEIGRNELIASLYHGGLAIEQIANAAKLSVQAVQEIIEKSCP